MKIKLRTIIIIVIIIALFLLIKLGAYIASQSINMIDEEEEYQTEFLDESKIMGEGVLTSFNIEKLETSYWTKIDEVLVNDDEMVKENQKLLKVSNNDATGEIYSTIEGKFFIQESGLENNYYIYDLNNVGIEITVDEEDSVKIKHGQKVNVKFTGNSDNYEGRVYYIQQIPANGEFKVRIKIDYTDKIKLGCNAKVEILLNEEPDINTPEYDLKNSSIKIGKTKISFKNEVSMQDFDMEAMFEDYMNQMMGDMDMNYYEGMEDEMPLEFDEEAISKYYSDYWNTYWKAYYEEYQTIIEVPDGVLDDISNNNSEEIPEQ